MEIVFIIFVALLIFLLIIHMILLSCATNIGKKGHKNMMIKSLFGIAESLLSFVIVLIWFINFNPSNKAYLVGIAIFGIVLFISNIIILKGLLRETSNNLVTEVLSDIRIVPTGHYYRALKLEGIANGSRSFFIFRGPDKAIIQQIKESGLNQVTIVYHASNRRIESVSTLSHN